MPARIDETDRRLAAALVDAPGATFAELADRLGVAASTLSPRYRRLRRAGLIRIVGRPRVGAESGPERLLRIPLSPTAADAAVAAARESEAVLWSRISADRAELLALVAGDADPWPVQDAHDRPAGPVAARAAVLHRWGADPVGRPEPAVRIDAVDELLLDALARDGRTDLRGLAAAAGIDPSTASRRRRRLIDSGIVRLEALVDPRVRRSAAETMLWLQVPPGRIVEVGRALHAEPEVDFVAALSGPAVLAARVRTEPGLGALDFTDRVCGRLGVTGVELTPLLG